MTALPEDIDMRLLSEKPIIVGGIPIYPVSLNAIAFFGYSKYSYMLKILCLNKQDMLRIIGGNVPDISDADYYGLWLDCISGDAEAVSLISLGLSEICRTKASFADRELRIGKQLIDAQIFLAIQNIIALRNGLIGSQAESDNPADDKARVLLEKRNRYRIKIKEMKDDAPDLTLADLISILASGLQLTIASVMDYDLYQFNNQFQRLAIMKDYDTNIQALVHGAKSEDIELTHWITKLKTRV